MFHDSRFTLAYGMLVLILCHCFCCRVLLIFTYTFATFNTCSCSLCIQATLSPSHTTVSVSVMSSKSKGVVDDAELAVLSEEQLRELAEFIDPDVSHPVSVFVTITCSFIPRSLPHFQCYSLGARLHLFCGHHSGIAFSEGLIFYSFSPYVVLT